MEGGEEKSVFASFFGWPEDREFLEEKEKKKAFCGLLQHEQQVIVY